MANAQTEVCIINVPEANDVEFVEFGDRRWDETLRITLAFSLLLLTSLTFVYYSFYLRVTCSYLVLLLCWCECIYFPGRSSHTIAVQRLESPVESGS